MKILLGDLSLNFTLKLYIISVLLLYIIIIKVWLLAEFKCDYDGKLY